MTNEQFREWERNVLGYGYGTGEPHVLAALKTFLEHCNKGERGESYEYEGLEQAVTPTVAWLLINILCRHDANVLEYGTSARYGWLTPFGVQLRDFLAAHTVEQLQEILDEEE